MNNKYIRKINSTYDNKTLLDTSIPQPKIKFTGIEKGKLKSKILSLPKPLIQIPKPVPPPRLRVLPRKNLTTELDRALKNTVKSFEVAIVESKDPDKQLYYTANDVVRTLEQFLQSNRGLKAYLTLYITFKKIKIIDGEEIYEFKNAYFNSNTFTIMNSHEINDALAQGSQILLNRIAIWVSEGSGWTVEVILSHYVNVVKYVPLRGNSYIPLPKELQNSKKGLINLKNGDNKCFLWCHVRHLNPQNKDPQRIKLTDKEFQIKLDYSCITFPVTIKQINRIEKQNNININVFGYDESVYPIRISNERYNDHMELLYIEKKEQQKLKQHYVYIKNFNSLMYYKTKHKDKKHFCMYCLQCFYSVTDLENHKENCIVINGVQSIELPKIYIDKKGENRIPSVYFKNYHKQLPVPFVIYADFESITEKISTCLPSNQKSYTEKYQRHTA